MESLSENIAHFTHGMASMFFISVGIHLFWQQNKSRLLRFLFYEMVLFAFIEIKDMVYLIEGAWYSDDLTRIFLSIDTWIVPFTLLFLFELISPGWITARRTFALVAPSVIMSLLLVFIPSDRLFHWITVYSLLLATIALWVVFMASARYDNHLKKNFSYTEELSVSWVRTIVVILFLYLVLWFFILQYENRWGDTIYYLITIAVWSFIYLYSLQHAVIEIPKILYPYRKKTESGDIKESDCPYQFAETLKQAIEKDKLYLNPNLHITDVASAINTNRTYLSNYLNKHLHTTFYDYVNAFRVEMACELLLNERNQTIEQIVEECGFNSHSTFNRSFFKIKQCSPSEYRRRHR